MKKLKNNMKKKDIMKEMGNKIIGEDESEAIISRLYFGETMVSILADKHRRMQRNQLRAEQRERLNKLGEMI